MQTYGWDTVFVVTIAKVNELLALHTSKFIDSFNYKDEQGVAFSGTFGPWRIVRDGSDSLLNFEISIASGILTTPLDSTPIDLAGVVPVMQLQLSFIEDQTAANTQALVFNLTTPGQRPGDTTPGAVTTITTDTTGLLKARDTTGLATTMLHDALPKLLIANRAQLAFVFASVNLVPPDAASCLAPKRFVYHYDQPVATGGAFLAILASVTDRDVSNLKRAIDPALLAGPYDLFFLLAPGLFLQSLILPSLPPSFGHGATSGNFLYSAGQIINNGRLGIDGKKVGLITYYPSVDSLSIKVDADDLLSVASGSFDITGLTDAYVTFSVTTRNSLTYDTSSQSIQLNGDPSPSRSYDKHVPWWEYVVSGIGGPIIIAVVDIVIATVTNAVASSVGGSLGGNLSVATMATQTIDFNGLDRFNVKDAGLADGFYMRGHYN
jgi:hypothetical protein